MGKKKPSKYKPGKYQFIVSSDKPIVRIEDLDPTNYPVKVIKPTLNSKGGVMKANKGVFAEDRMEDRMTEKDYDYLKKGNKPEKPLLKFPKEKTPKAKKPLLKKFDKDRKTKLQYANDPPPAMRKDTTTGFGVNIIEEVEGKRLGGDVSCKGGGAAVRGTNFKGVF